MHHILCTIYYQGDQIKNEKLDARVEKRNVNRILVGKSDKRRQLARPRKRWENNVKIDLKR
jgi:hypothetical protein